MRANSLSGMMLTGGTSLEYFTGVRWGLSERLFAVILLFEDFLEEASQRDAGLLLRVLQQVAKEAADARLGNLPGPVEVGIDLGLLLPKWPAEDQRN